MTSPQTRVSVDIPEGLTFRGLDSQTGLVRPDGIIHALLWGRKLTFDKTDLIKHQQLSSGGGILVVASGEFNVSPDIYQGYIHQRHASVTLEFLSCRKSSAVFKCSYVISGNDVAYLKMNMVNVDKNTRKPIPFPDWWAEMFKDFYGRAEGPQFKGLPRETETFFKGLRTSSVAITVQRRDQDSYRHVSIVSYVQYCIDVLENHLHCNKADSDIDTVSLLLKRARYLHLGESRAGDLLTVAFWEDKGDPQSICFDISKFGTSVYQAKMEFYGKHIIKSKI